MRFRCISHAPQRAGAHYITDTLQRAGIYHRLFWFILLFCAGALLTLWSPSIALAQGQSYPGAMPTADLQGLPDQPGFHRSKPAISPDARWLAVTVVPSGAGTAKFAATYLLATTDSTLLTTLNGYAPVWSNDSLQLFFENETGTFVYHLAEQRLEQLTAHTSQSAEAASFAQPQLPLAYPQRIRVAHHPSNGCRDVADWQVDVIPFEEYVAQVLPAEVPASWPAAALEAMAVAARTYAWRQILVGRPDYDLTDWANFQMMCADRYPSTDAAVSATAGQYLTAKNEMPGIPISAMYSAENGHPTLTNPNVTYLQAMPDLFALGRTRAGHGYGLSQWGAYRRARAGQNYRQILGHYYSAVYLQNGLDPTKPAAGLVGLLPQTALATDSLHLVTLGPHDWPVRLVITANLGLSSPVTWLGDEAIWRAASPLPENASVTAQLWLQDQLYDQVNLTVDRSAPDMPAFQPPAIVNQPIITFSLPAVANTTPLLYSNWVWRGEDLLHTANSGALIADLQALDGVAWGAQAGVQQKGVWYGPRTTVLPAGDNYRALFWLRAGSGASAAASAHRVARLDVTDDEGRELLGLRDLWTSDFAAGGQYQPIAVDFHLFQEPRGLEFRVAWPGVVDLALDRVEIWRLPSRSDPTRHQFRLPLYGQMGALALNATQMDSAGNLSPSISRTLTLVDSDAPLVAPWPLTASWLTTHTLSLSIPVTDSFSGLDVGQSAIDVAGQAYSATLPATFLATKLPWQGQPLTTLLSGLPDDKYTLTLRVADRAGNVRTQAYPLGIDTHPPTITAQLSGKIDQGWYGEPVTMTLVATDTTSGIAHVDYALATLVLTEPVFQRYAQPLRLTTGGVHQLTYRAIDQAGNQTPSQTITAALDLAAPVVVLQQYPLWEKRVHLVWQVTDDGSGVKQVEMQVQQGEGDWQPAPWDFTALHATDIDLDPETPIHVRARAQDQVGRRSEWVTIELVNAAAWLYLPLIQR